MVNTLAPAGSQRVEDLGIRVPEGAHRGTDSVGEVSQHRRIERIGLGQRPGGPGESRTWRGLTTTTGSAAAASAATSGNSRPPVASSITRAGPQAHHLGNQFPRRRSRCKSLSTIFLGLAP